ncbi:MAG: hypothetical protein Q4B86_02315 [Eubacteriales bacterium]|nr:hypothetical protein [Eubacteriales bacterium]
MEKKKGFGLFGAAVVVGAAAVVIKYLKDYTDFKAAAEEDFHDLEEGTTEVKEACKRTYYAIKDKEDVKQAAGELCKATGEVAKDAGTLCYKAGVTTVQAVKDMKDRYDEDPVGVKSEVISNLKDMGADVSKKISDVALMAHDKLREDTEECDAECADIEEAVEEDMAEEAAETAEDDAEPEDSVESAEDKAETVDNEAAESECNEEASSEDEKKD